MQHDSDNRPLTKRLLIILLILLAAWCIKLFTHELGHLVAGWLGGATLQHAELRPWHLPHCIFNPDPRPLLTLWGGPLLGVFLPLSLAAALRRNWGWSIAWFCVLANGLYLAAAWWSGDRFLDTPRLLDQGAWPSAIAFYCLVTISFGYVGLRRELRRALTIARPPVSEQQ